MSTQAHQQDFKVALDIGTTKVAAVAGRKNKAGKIEIIGFSKIYNTGVAQGEIFNLLDTTTNIKYVIEDMRKKFGITTDKVSVGLSGKHIRMLTLTDHITHSDFNHLFRKEDIEKLRTKIHKSVVKKPGEEILEIIPQHYLIDGTVITKHPVGAMGKRLEGTFRVVLGNEQKNNLIRQSLEKAGLQLDLLTLQSIASAKAVLTPRQLDAGAVLLDIGGGTSDIMIVKDRIIRHVGVIPYGGDFLTEHLKHELKLLAYQAEKLKILHGSALSHHIKDNTFFKLEGEDEVFQRQINAKEFAAQIQNALDFITHFIQVILKDYEKQFPADKLMAGIHVTGGGAHLKHLNQYFEYKLHLPAFTGSPGIHLSSNEFTSELSHPMYATVIGLLKMSLDREGTDEQPAKSTQTSLRENISPEHLSNIRPSAEKTDDQPQKAPPRPEIKEGVINSLSRKLNEWQKLITSLK